MNRDDIIRMAREAGIGWLERAEGISEFLERFANLVAAAERERIIAANAPEIEKLNVYIKALEDAVAAERARLAQPEPYAAQAAMVAQQTQGRMYVDPVTGDVGIGTVKWDASAPLVMHPHPAFQATQPQPDLAKVGEVGVWGERQWQGLTDEEMMMIYGQNHEGKKYNFGRAIEAKLKEKNT